MATEYSVDIDSLGPAVRCTSTGETLYICPYCPSNDPDEKGHLYVNRVKGVGECKRCQTAIVVKEGYTGFVQKFMDFMAGKDITDSEGGEDIGTGVRMHELKKTVTTMGFRPIHKDFQHEYLRERHITGDIAEEANVFFNPKTHELLFPFINPFTLDTVSGWAIRKVAGGGWVNTKSAKKNLYLPSKKIATSKYLIIVEGISDALSLYARGYPAVSIGGNTITPLQTKQLLMRMPTHIDLLLDKDAQAPAMSLATGLRNTVRNSNRECRIIFVECPVKDPAVMSWEDLVDVLGGDFEPPLGTNYAGFCTKLKELDARSKPEKKGNGVDKGREGYM
ncbi:MAG: toprim domain-containing protein [Dehalococcoidia bacterium]